MKRSLLYVLLCTVVGSSSILAQERITAEEYWKPIREAYAKERKLARRKSQSVISRWNGKETSEEWTYTWQPPGRIHYIHTETRDGRTRRTEQIDIDGMTYCKRNGADWVISKSACIGGGAFGDPSKIADESRTRQNVTLNGHKATLPTRRITYVNQYSKTAEIEGLSYSETKTWLNSDGLIIRSESSRGLISESKPSSETKEQVDYDKNIKVEAPIK